MDRLRNRTFDLAAEIAGKDPLGREVSLDAGNEPVGLTSLHQRLIELDADREAIAAELHYLKNHPLRTEDRESASSDGDARNDPLAAIRAWRAAVVESESLVAQIKATDEKWEDNPNYVQLDKATKNQRSALHEYEAESRKHLGSQQLAGDELGGHPPNYTLEKRLAGLAAKREFLAKHLSELTGNQEERRSKSTELQFARAELERENKVFELIAQRKLALQTEMRAPARVKRVRKAVVPEAPIERLPYRRLAIACAVAFLIPFATVGAFCLWEKSATRTIGSIEKR